MHLFHWALEYHTFLNTFFFKEPLWNKRFYFFLPGYLKSQFMYPRTVFYFLKASYTACMRGKTWWCSECYLMRRTRTAVSRELWTVILNPKTPSTQTPRAPKHQAPKLCGTKFSMLATECCNMQVHVNIYTHRHAYHICWFIRLSTYPLIYRTIYLSVSLSI